MNKNHEGYSDPTAFKAIKRVCRRKRRKERVKETVDTLTYQLKEVPGFKELVERYYDK